ncbi:MAG: hypothetical protein CVV13_04495 [Gammaproteobacteria bacterium HGW-Gammaproteobacteria-3]|nr:MAG: hypothetical protein CVV13_04495 [Gammaproteobacteria bacterium HGW-Gammaproteobacteria-3]
MLEVYRQRKKMHLPQIHLPEHAVEGGLLRAKLLIIQQANSNRCCLANSDAVSIEIECFHYLHAAPDTFERKRL